MQTLPILRFAVLGQCVCVEREEATCVFVRMYACMYKQKNTHTHIHTHTHTHIHVYILTSFHMCHMNMHACMHAYMHTCIHACCIGRGYDLVRLVLQGARCEQEQDAERGGEGKRTGGGGRWFA